MENQQQFHTQSTQKPLYKKWWFWTFMVCNTFVIGFLFFATLGFYNENQQYKETLQQYESSTNDLENQIGELQNQMSNLKKESEDLAIKLKEKETIEADASPALYNDYTFPIEQLDKLFDFQKSIIDKDNITREELVPYLYYFEYFIQSNLFYNKLHTSTDSAELLSITKNYLASVVYLIVLKHQLGILKDEDYDLLIKSTQAISEATANFISNEINKNKNEDTLKIILDLVHVIDSTIQNFAERDIVSNLL